MPRPYMTPPHRPDRIEDSLLNQAREEAARRGETLIWPGARHWQIFERLCRDASATGNLAKDAWFPALAIESRCEWITTDRDHARFPGLRGRTPW